MQNFDQIISDLKQARDLARVKAHLGSMAVQEEWRELEKRWENFRGPGKARSQCQGRRCGIGSARIGVEGRLRAHQQGDMSMADPAELQKELEALRSELRQVPVAEEDGAGAARRRHTRRDRAHVARIAGQARRSRRRGRGHGGRASLRLGRRRLPARNSGRQLPVAEGMNMDRFVNNLRVLWRTDSRHRRYQDAPRAGAVGTERGRRVARAVRASDVRGRGLLRAAADYGTTIASALVLGSAEFRHCRHSVADRRSQEARRPRTRTRQRNSQVTRWRRCRPMHGCCRPECASFGQTLRNPLDGACCR